MRAQITKCESMEYTWYNGRIGDTFNVIKEINDNVFLVDNDGFEQRISKSDCVVLNEDDHMPRHIREVEDTPGGSTPSQYQLPDNATDLQDLIEHRDMNFAMGNIFKACYRSGNCSHSDLLRDINKIIWFAKRELKRLTND